MIPIHAGALDQRITLESPSYSKSSTGEDVATWSTVATLWAQIVEQQPSGQETYKSDRDTSEQWYTVTIRRYRGVRPDMRILWGPAVLDIRSVTSELGRSDRVVMTCREQR